MTDTEIIELLENQIKEHEETQSGALSLVVDMDRTINAQARQIGTLTGMLERLAIEAGLDRNKRPQNAEDWTLEHTENFSVHLDCILSKLKSYREEGSHK